MLPWVFIFNGDTDAVRLAYAIGSNMISKGECDEDREDLMEAITVASEDALTFCPGCAELARQ